MNTMHGPMSGHFVEREPRRIKVGPPQIVRPAFSDGDFQKLKESLTAQLQAERETNRSCFESGFGRFAIWHTANSVFADFFERSVEVARRVFGSNTLVPSYAMYTHYEKTATLERHKDSNACSYTLDLCLYQQEPWDIWVEGKAYTLHPNEALAFYGNDQEHWREAFPNPATNFVSMVFLHYVEPEHWFQSSRGDYVPHIEFLTKQLARLEDPEQRLFISMLLQAWNARDLYRFVRQEFPEGDPHERVFRWVEAMAVPGGPLGVSLNRATLLIARRLAQGVTPERIAEEINRSRTHAISAADVENVRQELLDSTITMLFP